ncbi:hypothetical protein VTK26DRAFT_4486 [Humicola hyalothermophila]
MGSVLPYTLAPLRVNQTIQHGKRTPDSHSPVTSKEIGQQVSFPPCNWGPAGGSSRGRRWETTDQRLPLTSRGHAAHQTPAVACALADPSTILHSLSRVMTILLRKTLRPDYSRWYRADPLSSLFLFLLKEPRSPNLSVSDKLLQRVVLGPRLQADIVGAKSLAPAGQTSSNRMLKVNRKTVVARYNIKVLYGLEIALLKDPEANLSDILSSLYP